VVLFVISAVGVAGLMVVANQYRKALSGSVAPGSLQDEDGPGRAARWVDGFLAAREATQAVVASDPAGIKQLTAIVSGDFRQASRPSQSTHADVSSTYRNQRASALTAHGMTYDDYVSVRRAWRAWTSGAPLNDPALAAVFEERRDELAAAGLGTAEAIDDAIR